MKIVQQNNMRNDKKKMRQWRGVWKKKGRKKRWCGIKKKWIIERENGLHKWGISYRIIKRKINVKSSLVHKGDDLKERKVVVRLKFCFLCITIDDILWCFFLRIIQGRTTVFSKEPFFFWRNKSRQTGQYNLLTVGILRSRPIQLLKIIRPRCGGRRGRIWGVIWTGIRTFKSRQGRCRRWPISEWLRRIRTTCASTR